MLVLLRHEHSLPVIDAGLVMSFHEMKMLWSFLLQCVPRGTIAMLIRQTFKKWSRFLATRNPSAGGVFGHFDQAISTRDAGISRLASVSVHHFWPWCGITLETC